MNIYHLRSAACPSGFSDPLLRARRVHGPAAAFNVYKSRAPPAARPSSPSIFSQHSLARPFGRIMRRRPLLPRPTRNPPFVDLAAAKTFDGTVV
jgi:hypothetical protein